MIQGLPDDLRMELVKHLYVSCCAKVPLFLHLSVECVDKASVKHLTSVYGELDYVTFVPHECIIQRGQPGLYYCLLLLPVTTACYYCLLLLPFTTVFTRSFLLFCLCWIFTAVSTRPLLLFLLLPFTTVFTTVFTRSFLLFCLY